MVKARGPKRQSALQGSSKVSRQLQLQLQEEDSDSICMQENRSPLASPLAMKNF